MAEGDYYYDSGSARTGTNVAMRDYRKGNWTVSETMVLIEAKKMDDERRNVKRSPGKVSMEPRWKWVEEYCWRKGCYRSQNQCNDKWDNLMRDYKKVRDYQRRRNGDGGGGGESGASSSSSTYWNMDKAERKERSLPANMIPQVYDALVDVVERKAGGGSTDVVTASQLPLVPSAVTIQPTATLSSPLPRQEKSYLPSPELVMVPDQPALTQPPPGEATEPPQCAFPARARESEDTSREHSESPAKRRRTSEGRDVGAAITDGTRAIAEAIQASEEREERRHRDTVKLQERRLRIEEARNEINRQGIGGLVDAINRLATSIQSLAASKNVNTATTTTNNNNNSNQQ